MNHQHLRRLALAGASAAALGFAAPAFAVEEAPTDVGDVVVTAPNYVPQGSVATSKAGIPLIENPQSVTVISRDQIELLGWNNLSQVVRYTAGVTGENYGPDERLDWLTQRGFNPVQYIDGIQSSIGSISTTGLDLYLADSVEILKGPASFLYGSAPPGGIVNLTSRHPRSIFGGEVEAQLGNNDRWQINGDVTGEVAAGVDARLTGLYREQGTQITDVDSRRALIAPSVAFGFGDSTRVTLLSFWQDDEVEGDGRGFLPIQGTLQPNPNGKLSSSTNLGETTYNRFTRTHWGIGYELTHAFGDGFAFEQNVKYTELENSERGLYGNGFAPDLRTVNRYSFSFAEDVQTLGVDNRLTRDLDAGWATHKLLVGVDYRNYDYVGASAFVGAPSIDAYAPVYGLAITAPALTVFSDYTQEQTGLYAQDQIEFDGGLILTVGGRLDWVDGEDAEPSWRAGLTYVFENGVAPYVSAARSFQPVGGADASGDRFDPTTGTQFEAGVKWDGRGLPDGFKVFATAAVYRIVQQNVLTDDLANPGFSVQTGEVEVQGFEAEAVARLNERLSVNLSYTWTDSEVTESNAIDLGAKLPVTPEHKASALVDYTFQNGALAGLGGSLGVRYTSSSQGSLPIWYAPTVYTSPSVTLWDSSIHYDRADWRFSLSANNLFDEEYVARCQSASNCFYGTRRTVIASITRRF